MKDICEKCGSNKIIPNARVNDRDNTSDFDLTVSVDENPDAFIFKHRTRSRVLAKVCGDCGFIELYAEDPKSLYSALQNQEPRLKLVK